MGERVFFATNIFVTASEVVTVPWTERASSRSWHELPEDFEVLLGRKGYRFRDTFTKLCMYAIEKAAVPIDRDDYVIVASQTGNVEALSVFLSDCFQENIKPYGTQFANATTSASATNINIKHQIRGGNLTINAAHDSLFLALVAASFFLTRNPENRAHLFFGNVFYVTDNCPGGNALLNSGAHYLALERTGDLRLELSRGPTEFRATSTQRTCRLDGLDWFQTASMVLQSVLATQDASAVIDSDSGSIRLSRG